LTSCINDDLAKTRYVAFLKGRRQGFGARVFCPFLAEGDGRRAVEDRVKEKRRGKEERKVKMSSGRKAWYISEQ
jgi:hypothetical protein